MVAPEKGSTKSKQYTCEAQQEGDDELRAERATAAKLIGRCERRRGGE